MSEFVRAWWEELRARLDAEARAEKQSQAAVVVLAREYAAADDATRVAINQVLSDWLLSPDGTKRYDARYLVRAFNIIDALPELNELACRLGTTPGSPALYELRRIREVIDALK